MVYFKECDKFSESVLYRIIDSLIKSHRKRIFIQCFSLIYRSRENVRSLFCIRICNEANTFVVGGQTIELSVSNFIETGAFAECSLNILKIYTTRLYFLNFAQAIARVIH